MFKPSRLFAVVAIASIPVAALATSAVAQTPYTPYTPAPTPTPVVTPTPGPSAAPLPAVVLKSVETAISNAFKTLKFGRVLGQGHSTFTIPAQGAGTYTVTISYREPGKKLKSIAKASTIVKAPGKSVSVAIKPNANGKSVYKKLKAAKKKTIKVQITVSFETGGKTVSTTIAKTFKR